MITYGSYVAEKNVESDVYHKHGNKRKKIIRMNKKVNKNIFVFDRARTFDLRVLIELFTLLISALDPSAILAH